MAGSQLLLALDWRRGGSGGFAASIAIIPLYIARLLVTLPITRFARFTRFTRLLSLLGLLRLLDWLSLLDRLAGLAGLVGLPLLTARLILRYRLGTRPSRCSRLALRLGSSGGSLLSLAAWPLLILLVTAFAAATIAGWLIAAFPLSLLSRTILLLGPAGLLAPSFTVIAIVAAITIVTAFPGLMGIAVFLARRPVAALLHGRAIARA